MRELKRLDSLIRETIVACQNAESAILREAGIEERPSQDFVALEDLEGRLVDAWRLVAVISKHRGGEQ